MNEFLENLKKQAEEQPMVAMGIAAAVIGAVGKLINANTNHRNAKTWNREVDRRIKKSQKVQKP